jgi:probable HAF family extracellular repeat protein
MKLPILPIVTAGLALLSMVATAAGQTDLASAPPPMPAPTYTITDLGSLGDSYSVATSINASGQIVGDSLVSWESSHGFLYDNGTMTDLGTLGGRLSFAADINASGQIAGDSQPGNSRAEHAFLYSAGTMTDLGTLGGLDSEAAAINDGGQIVGASGVTTGHTYQHHAFLFDSGTMTDLGTLGGPNSMATDINTSGQIVGYSDVSAFESHAFLYSGGTMTDLGTLGGPSSYAAALNDVGQIVGASLTADGVCHAFLYDNGTMTDLGTLADTAAPPAPTATPAADDEATEAGDAGEAHCDGGWHHHAPQSHAYAINSQGQIVGDSDATPTGEHCDGPHAFLYENGTILDLNDLIPADSGWTLSRAFALNDSGAIVGAGINPDGTIHGYLLTPGVAITSVQTTPSAVLKTNKIRGRTSASQLTVSGGALGNVTGVFYRTSPREPFRKASGTTHWQFKAKLATGRNVITIVAKGADNKSDTKRITIVRH